MAHQEGHALRINPGHDRPAEKDGIEDALLKMRLGAASRDAFLHLWRLAGERPGPVTIHQADLGEVLGAKDQARSGKYHLQLLRAKGVKLADGETIALIVVTARTRGEWKIEVSDPREVAERMTDATLAIIDKPAQGELYVQEPANFPEDFPAEVLRVADVKAPNTNTPAGKSSGKFPGSLDDAAYLQTAEGLADLWLATLRRYRRGRPADERRDIVPAVQETLDAGFAPEVIERAIRDRPNKMEWYNELHRRLVEGKKDGKGKGNRTDRQPAPGDFDPEARYPSAKGPDSAGGPGVA